MSNKLTQFISKKFGQVETNTMIMTNSSITNLTGANLMMSNSTVNGTLLVKNSLNAPFNSHTLGSMITTGGNVGVGTTAPSYKLDITGDINFTGSIYQNGSIFSGGGGGSITWSTVSNFSNSWQSDPTDQLEYTKDSNGFVYIRGSIQSGTIDTVAFTLPEGYRPLYENKFAISDQVGYDTTLVMSISTTGNATPLTPFVGYSPSTVQMNVFFSTI